MKKNLAIAFVLFCTASLHAQSDDHFLVSFTFGLSLPTGNFKTTNKTGFSGRMNFDFDIAPKLRLVASSGSADYSGKSYNTNYGYSGSYNEYDFIPLNAGLKYFYAGGLFVEAQAGGAFSIIAQTKGFGYNYAPSVGFEFGYLDVSFRYDTYNLKGANLNAATFSLSYGF